VPHTYKDHAASDRHALAGLLLFLLIFAFGSVYVVRRDGFTTQEAIFLSLAAIASALLFVGAYRHQYLGICHEIRIDEDGSCELETRRRTIRLHVLDIYAVRYNPETSDHRKSYQIRFKGGKLSVADTMSAFVDFVRRLKLLNPDVDLIRFPADFELVPSDTANPRGRLEALGTILFSAVVVLLLLYLAKNTLL
jgi:hypothetical protein